MTTARELAKKRAYASHRVSRNDMKQLKRDLKQQLKRSQGPQSVVLQLRLAEVEQELKTGVFD